MLRLEKKQPSQEISLAQAVGPLTFMAEWEHPDDTRQDDLDLRAGILLPDGRMRWLAASHPGALDSAPHARHLGDAVATEDGCRQREVIEVDPQISRSAGGPVAIVFSVYSATSSGKVPITSLRPGVRILHEGGEIDARLEPRDTTSRGVYTYILCVADFVGDKVEIRPSGMTSPRGSEATPWLRRRHGELLESFDGVPVYKRGRGFLGRLFGGGGRGYVNV